MQQSLHTLQALIKYFRLIVFHQENLHEIIQISVKHTLSV
jgi:hypothetical protein